MELDRRNFLKGAALTAVGAVGATALAGCAPTSKEDADAAKQSAGTPDG